MITIINQLNNSIELLKKGGSIHIKKENRGKFTETKKRTGKTAEELVHSKNPLTRKRAQFAINARKWKHQNGGIINGDSNPHIWNERPYTDDEIVDLYINNYLWNFENSIGSGLRKDGLYEPYSNIEKGKTVWFIGPGIHVNSHGLNQNSVLSREELNNIAKEHITSRLPKLINSLHTMNGGKYNGLWDRLRTNEKLLYIDRMYTLRETNNMNMPEKSPKLTEHIYNRDWESAKKETDGVAAPRQAHENEFFDAVIPRLQRR